ncbi:MAG TPA: HipA domain-containing protein [Longimicrobiaceae bacterium]|nr:HipA domain-containing protein [Longimicrobiaceae bacterium]
MTVSARGDVPRELAVLLDGVPVATLYPRVSGATYTLVYDEAWRTNPDAYPVSLSLPLASPAHEGPVVRHYLRGLIPDNPARLQEISHRYRVSPDDPYAVLSHIGEDCAGAVQFVRPERVAELTTVARAGVEWLGEDELAHLLAEISHRSAPEHRAIETGRFSLPGALGKVALVWDRETRRWGRPSGRAASTHILKPPLAGVRHHNENEHFCLELARQLEFRAASSRVLRIGDQSAICVERYDRARRGSRVVRLHQEDVSQALGADPLLRYAGEGAPGIREIVELLRDHARSTDVESFMRAVALNWIIAGTDAHSRNYSVLIKPGGTVELAPLYDLASALGFEEVNRPVEELVLAMAIGGHARIADIDAAAWRREIKAIRARPGRILPMLVDLAERIPDAARAVAERAAAEGVDEAFLVRMRDAIVRRAAQCADELRHALHAP